MIATAIPSRATTAGRQTEPPLTLGVGAVTRAAIAAGDMAEKRRELAVTFKDTLTSSVVKNADEQSLVALVALAEAIRHCNSPRRGRMGSDRRPALFRPNALRGDGPQVPGTGRVERFAAHHPAVHVALALRHLEPSLRHPRAEHRRRR